MIELQRISKSYDGTTTTNRVIVFFLFYQLNPGDDKYASVTFLHEATWAGSLVDIDHYFAVWMMDAMADSRNSWGNACFLMS